MVSEAFEEAFRRFENVVDTHRINSFEDLKSAFASFEHMPLGVTFKQENELAKKARKLGLEVWMTEARRIKRWRTVPSPEGMIREMYRARRFSPEYPSYSVWRQETHTSAYRQRIESYMRRHPEASLSEARGHKR